MSLDLAYYKPVVGVCFAYIALFYVFLYAQAGYVWLTFFKEKAKDPATKLAKVKYGGTPTGDKLMFDRTVGNLMEQSVPFILSLFLSAAFGDDVQYTAQLGYFYVGVRLFYPIVFTTLGAAAPRRR